MRTLLRLIRSLCIAEMPAQVNAHMQRTTAGNHREHHQPQGIVNGKVCANMACSPWSWTTGALLCCVLWTDKKGVAAFQMTRGHALTISKSFGTDASTCDFVLWAYELAWIWVCCLVPRQLFERIPFDWGCSQGVFPTRASGCMILDVSCASKDNTTV